ncbi:hypothetical protein [Acidiferrobacter sp.]|uniref:hypothetical protein n=1 Tax=Acidiferrobacter sp. TaxID=1872107 RepID=UPI00261E5E23|nr:hypothetical protein [Acidiferrobacter sp.]
MHETLRAYFLEGRPSHEVARDFGDSAGSFGVPCHAFRHDPARQFCVSSNVGPRDPPKEPEAHDLVIALRKQNRLVYEIAEQNLSMRAWATFAYSRWSVAVYDLATGSLGAYAR